MTPKRDGTASLWRISLKWWLSSRHEPPTPTSCAHVPGQAGGTEPRRRRQGRLLGISDDRAVGQGPDDAHRFILSPPASLMRRTPSGMAKIRRGDQGPEPNAR